MDRSFEESSVGRLIAEALAMRPDHSEWPGEQRPTDKRITRAPARIGKYLARKKKTLAQKRAESDQSDIQRRIYEVEMSILQGLAMYEFLKFAATLSNPESVVLRNNGWIVRVGCG